jgi:hypothetical protein
VTVSPRRIPLVLLTVMPLSVGCADDNEARPYEQIISTGRSPNRFVIHEGRIMVTSVVDGSCSAADLGPVGATEAADSPAFVEAALPPAVSLACDPIVESIVPFGNELVVLVWETEKRPELLRVDPSDGEVLGTMTIPESAVAGYSNPRLATSPLVAIGDVLAVAVQDGSFTQLVAFNPRADTAAWQVTVDGAFESAAVTPERVWMLSRRRLLEGIDTVTERRVERVDPLPSDQAILDDNATALSAAPDGSLWAIDQPESRLFRLDPLTGAAVDSWPLTFRPHELYATNDAIWLVNNFDDRITVVDRAALKEQ